MRRIYVVAGLPRTGTSMMMRCIHESSALTLVGDRNIERLPVGPDGSIRPRTAEYDFNPYGVYEVERPPVWWALPDLSLIKRILTSSVIPPPFDGLSYFVCSMRRERDEVTASWWRTFGSPFDTKRFELAEEMLDYMRDWGHAITEVDYNRTIEDPLKTFLHLEEEGWPIDPRKAAVLVEPALYRHRSSR